MAHNESDVRTRNIHWVVPFCAGHIIFVVRNNQSQTTFPAENKNDAEHDGSNMAETCEHCTNKQNKPANGNNTIT